MQNKQSLNVRLCTKFSHIFAWTNHCVRLCVLLCRLWWVLRWARQARCRCFRSARWRSWSCCVPGAGPRAGNTTWATSSRLNTRPPHHRRSVYPCNAFPWVQVFRHMPEVQFFSWQITSCLTIANWLKITIFRVFTIFNLYLFQQLNLNELRNQL